jgi:hypothetical protein
MIKKLMLLALAALAVGMAVPSSRARIQEEAITPVMDAIGTRIAPGRVRAMADQLDVRVGRGERLPPDNVFSSWLRRDYTGPELDPWDRPWYIEIGRRSYTVGSMGPDGERGTDDDITETRDLPN